ncbi:MAG: nicotinate (nicotinamide) nucleotide adenylyltransferase [Clostridia bacterium]|nr:nicotinate (nicotinamide) nucleotide adenylyltransferase [Clostridia bacterium]
MEYIAVFGGTFNPFHKGHYEILETVCAQSFIKKVLLIPDRIPPHKNPLYLAPDKDRIEMCRIICDKFPKAELSTIEFERKGKSYTIDTVKLLKKKYKDENLAVICGGDMISSLSTWKHYKKLKKLVTFIAFNRDEDKDFSQYVSEYIRDGANIIVINKDITSVSSTELRENIDKDKLPLEIYEYIKKTGLYNGK